MRIRGNLVTSSADTLRLMALGRHDLFPAPTFLIPNELAAGSLVARLAEHRPVEFAIDAIYLHRHHLSPEVRAFIDLLAERFAEHRKWMNPEREPGLSAPGENKAW